MGKRGPGMARLGRRIAVLSLALLACSAAPAVELKQETIRAFQRYVELSEAKIDEQLARGNPFLYVDMLRAAERERALAVLRAGKPYIQPLETLDHGKRIDCPGGLIHHWVGTIFIPGATLDQVLAVVQDYNHHDEYYYPEVQRSKILSHADDDFTIYLRFHEKKVVTAVLDTYHEVHYHRVDARHEWSRSKSTRIQQVEDAGKKNEHLKPVGDDNGFLWRIDTYWRFEQRDGGTYVETQSISLTRDIPTGLGWLLGPYVESVPRESMAFSLEATRRVVEQRLASKP
jgi:hypothetical protein